MPNTSFVPSPHSPPHILTPLSRIDSSSSSHTASQEILIGMEGLDMNALPPGFGFHPTDAELVSHYLKRKIMGLQDGVIPEVDIYKHEPWDLPARSGIPSRDGKWHFFNIRDRKYPNGSRSNRATEKGYWKSTGKDRMIRSRNCNIGTKKTLVFHEGRPPMGKRTDWIMHEYYLDEKECKSAGIPKDSFVLCRVTKRNNFALEDEGHCEKEIVDAPLTPLPHKGDQVEPNRLKVEPQSSSESEYYADWFKELYCDPIFTMEVSSTANKGEKTDSNSGAVPLMLEPENLPLPNHQSFCDNVYRWPEVYAVEFPSTNIFDPLDSDFPAIFMNSIQGIEGAPVMEEVSTSGVSEAASDTGIVVRQRTPRATTVEPSRQRIKLQVHKMETTKAGVLKQTVQLDSCDHRIDSDDSTKVHPLFDTKNIHVRKVSEEVTFPTVREMITEEIHVTKDASTIETEYVSDFASCRNKDSSKWHTVKRSLRGVLKEARSLVRSCSCFGSNRLLVGTCLVGAAAMAAYLHQEDD